MKKILMLVAGMALSSSVFAAATALTAGGTTGSTTSVTTGACSALSETVKVNLSKSNVGAYECTATAVGVAAASTAGKIKVYRANSGGGAVKEASCAATSGCVESDVTSATTGASMALTESS